MAWEDLNLIWSLPLSNTEQKKRETGWRWSYRFGIGAAPPSAAAIVWLNERMNGGFAWLIEWLNSNHPSIHWGCETPLSFHFFSPFSREWPFWFFLFSRCVPWCLPLFKVIEKNEPSDLLLLIWSRNPELEEEKRKFYSPKLNLNDRLTEGINLYCSVLPYLPYLTIIIQYCRIRFYSLLLILIISSINNIKHWSLSPLFFSFHFNSTSGILLRNRGSTLTLTLT